MNAVEREPVETRVLNPTASEASYKPKQRSCGTTNLKKTVLAPNSPGTEMCGAELSSAETYPTHKKVFKSMVEKLEAMIIFGQNPTIANSNEH